MCYACDEIKFDPTCAKCHKGFQECKCLKSDKQIIPLASPPSPSIHSEPDLNGSKIIDEFENFIPALNVIKESMDKENVPPRESVQINTDLAGFDNGNPDSDIEDYIEDADGIEFGLVSATIRKYKEIFSVQ